MKDGAKANLMVKVSDGKPRRAKQLTGVFFDAEKSLLNQDFSAVKGDFCARSGIPDDRKYIIQVNF